MDRRRVRGCTLYPLPSPCYFPLKSAIFGAQSLRKVINVFSVALFAPDSVPRMMIALLLQAESPGESSQK